MFLFTLYIFFCIIKDKYNIYKIYIIFFKIFAQSYCILYRSQSLFQFSYKKEEKKNKISLPA